MKAKSKYNGARTLAIIKVALFVILINILFFPTLTRFTLQGNNRFTIFMGNVPVGVTDDAGGIFDCYREARYEVSKEIPGMTLIEYVPVTFEGEEVVYGEVDSRETIIANMKAELLSHKQEDMSSAYVVKIGDMIFSIDSAEDVKKLFGQAVSRYDVSGDFEVELVLDSGRELSVLDAVVKKKDASGVGMSDIDTVAGFEGDFTYDSDELLRESSAGFDSYEYGIESIGFSEKIEIAEAYVPTDELVDYEVAFDRLFNEQEVQQIYKVQSGDTLSGISVKVGLPMADIIALNSNIESEHSVINIDQEIIITVPEPEVAVVWTEVAKLEEAYNKPTEYIYNDNWFTNQQVTHQQPSAGYHEAVLSISHSNNTVVSKDTVYEEVLIEPVGKIVEVGTMIPPTYIKPLAGGMLSSRFGYRKSPGGRGSTNHKGVDWATPRGTPIYASCGGSVVSAGWSGGYGYCVYLTHPDGKQTRYAHLSSCAVSKGQSVSQGQIIGYSGNTGNSTGPHLHFEIIVNGVQVDPFNYL